ncbi:MAG TPA: Fe-S cluster assembly protein SufD [Stellaceae bacterium]|jgi:Fe-S cluster assembly protein SufD|nr:Fe-S cluster assembly protein SufD [Stellaceae bacterium]
MSAVVEFPAKPEARDYLACFARDITEPGWLAARRQQSMTRFAELGFPSRRSENWRYLDLQPLQQHPLLPARATATATDEATLRRRLSAVSLPDGNSRLVLVDGRFSPALSNLKLPKGVWFGSMAQAMRDRADLVQAAIEDNAADSAHPFTALNTAFFADGYVLDIAVELALDRIIEIIHLGSGATAGSFHTRSLISLGNGARARIVETYIGEGRYWRNDVVAVQLGTGAELSRAVLVEEGIEAVHLAQVDATLGTNSSFDGFALLLSGRRARQEANVRIVGEGARCRLDGAFLVAGNDEANIVTAVDHAAVGGRTRELIKGVAAGRGHGAFQGRIVVREHAQKTDAQQTSRNLIIGRRAVIDTKPELEIYADDVKCAHGATVGDLDEAALFYLRARGIPDDEARQMLIEGFLREAVEEIDDAAAREYLLRRLAARLARPEE